MSSNNDDEFGHIKCQICGAHDNIDINDTAAMLDWLVKHVFGHVGEEDKGEDNSRSKTGN